MTPGATSRRDFLRATGVAVAVPVVLGAWGSGAPPARNGDRITAFTLIHGIPGQEEDLKRHLVSLAAPTRAGPGCIRYDLYQLPDEKHEFLRYEEWESLEALEAHKQTPHIRGSFERRQREGWTTEIVIWDRVPDGAA